LIYNSAKIDDFWQTKIVLEMTKFIRLA